MKPSRKRNIVAHLDEWIDDEGNLRRWLHICTFSQFNRGSPLLNPDRVHNSEPHGLVSEADLLGNEEILVIKRKEKDDESNV